jgi:hypothetical protein
MEEKLNLHEMILKKKLKNAYVNKELKEKRENINEIIENRKNKNYKKNDFKSGEKDTDKDIDKDLDIHNEKGFDMINSNNLQYEKIKRDKAEKEYFRLLNEIKEAMEEVNIIKLN